LKTAKKTYCKKKEKGENLPIYNKKIKGGMESKK
jgi:hypothetical protein